jgi:pyruvate-formate lyase
MVVAAIVFLGGTRRLRTDPRVRSRTADGLAPGHPTEIVVSLGGAVEHTRHLVARSPVE